MALKKPAVKGPATFHQRLVDFENDRHSRRLYALKKAAAKIARFEPTFTELEAMGIPISCSDLSCPIDGSLEISSTCLASMNGRLLDALISLGYTEIKSDLLGAHYRYSTLKKGWVTLRIMLPTQYAEVFPRMAA